MEQEMKSKIRDFNRFYTKILGVLNRKYLGSRYSLPETRVIQAVFHAGGCSSKELGASLNMDKGYLSRLLRKFERQGYITRRVSESDRRREALELTEEGEAVFREIDAAADKSVEAIFDGLTDGQIAEMVDCMERIRQIMQDGRRSGEGIKEIEICQFSDFYARDVVDLALHFQNDGSRPFMTVEDQPDILSIGESYIGAGGNFWIAREKGTGRLVGTIGVVPYTDEVAVLKKFFVYEEFQGAPYHLGRQLYKQLIDFARGRGFKTIVLDTPRNTVRAHRFYEKAGFRQVEEEDLPIRYSYPCPDSDFFMLDISGNS